MKSKINEMYAQGLLTAGGIANAIASGWITDADAVSILGEEDGLAAAKTARIAQSKAALAAYLEAHPIQWTDGAYYAITADKQQQLASKTATDRSVAIFGRGLLSRSGARSYIFSNLFKFK